MDERVLTRRELNRALLARQLLLRRARLPLPHAVERLGALQAQWPPSPHVALWSRVEGFRREQLMRALERRTLVKATLMRATLHLVSARDYLAYAALFLRTRHLAVERRLHRLGVEVDADALVARVVAETAGGPRSRPELNEVLRLGKFDSADRRPWLVWHLLAARARLVHSPESSAWRLNTAGARFAPAAEWLGAEPSADGELLVRRYLRAFGPATRSDVLQWAGLPARAVDDALGGLRLRRFHDERGRELVDLPRALLPPADTPAPVRFLPMWDSALLAHADRTRILAEEYRATVIRRNGDIRPAFLVDGFVAGTWRFARGSMELEPFDPLPRRVRREVEDEAARLTAFHA
jgi:hypothetical protein